MYGPKIWGPLDLLRTKPQNSSANTPVEASMKLVPGVPANLDTFPAERQTSNAYRAGLVDVLDEIMFSAASMKQQFDRRHKPLFLNAGEFALPRLHRGFNVPGITGNTKLTQQYTGPF
ncbi:hypothetical protein K3495_g10181 [Podosphaera aphanis]|nr:hypothetical protein K3495_g10181 [Podosphaera aphanis]